MSNEEKPFSIEARYGLLLSIHRAAHFEWIRTIQRLYPECDVGEVVMTYWDEVAKDTARAYLRILDRDQPLAQQVARLIAKSSLAMGETVACVTSDEGATVEHTACPWWGWHQEQGFETLDRPGCDVWFQKVVAYINEAIGSGLRVETRSALPDGDPCCRRLITEGKST